MRSPGRSALALLLVLPLWLTGLAAASAQVVTADVNGDGIRDRIEAGRSGAEIVVRLSSLDPVQHLRAAGSILDVVLADIDHDGDSDLVVAATTARRRVGLFVWTNAGQGRFVSTARRHARATAWLGLRRLQAPGTPSLEEDLWGDPHRLFVQPSAAAGGRALAGEAVHLADAPAATRARPDRRSPRGPPAFTLLHS